MKKVLIVDERRRKAPPDAWWVSLNKRYQTQYSYDLDHAIASIKSVKFDLVIIGSMGPNADPLAQLLFDEGRKFMLLSDSDDELSVYAQVREAIKNRVLVVGHDPSILGLMEKILAEAEYRVQLVTSIIDADQFRSKFGYEVIIVDEVEGGIEWAECIYVPRRREVLITSGHLGAERVPRLIKPFTQAELLAAVAERVDNLYKDE